MSILFTPGYANILTRQCEYFHFLYHLKGPYAETVSMTLVEASRMFLTKLPALPLIELKMAEAELAALAWSPEPPPSPKPPAPATE